MAVQAAAGTFIGSALDDADAIHDNVAAEINAIAEKVTPVNADLVIIEDSADSNNKKKAQLGNLPGGGGDVQVSKFFADTLEIPNNADWVVNAFAAPGADSNDNDIGIRAFDDTIEEGVGFSESVPAGKTNIVLKFKSRAQTAGGAARTVGLKFYNRGFPDNAVPEAWSAGLVLIDVDIPNNVFYQYDEQTITLASLGITAGEMTHFELTRINPTGGTELVGDWNLALLEVSFT